eukprot:TRINITY_DN2954_c0_g1_i3.p1 TRINITY_DN2954_c0_g1~~TRINITY_DN2954_c0_g1_i3.p1  ORF type:complete len:218 (+),score=2.38 TRINITY_DN2954_c0_g1_i3:63-716(+)
MRFFFGAVIVLVLALVLTLPRATKYNKVIELAYEGNVEELTKQIASENVVDIKDQWGNTLLHWAAKGGHIPMIKFLLDKGINISAQNGAGSTALHWSVYQNSQELISFLIKHGLSPNIANNDSETALHWAVDWSRGEAVATLLQGGADPNSQDSDGNTPLHRISSDCDQSASCTQIVKTLIRHRADVTLKNKHGRLALSDFSMAKEPSSTSTSQDSL